MSARPYFVVIAVALCLALSETSLAAAVRHHSPAKHPRVVKQHRLSRSNPSGIPTFDYRRGTSDWPFGPGYNLPYPDRPYGNPDWWGEN